MTKVSLLLQYSESPLYTSDFTYFHEPFGEWEDRPSQGGVVYRLDQPNRMVEENVLVMCDFGQAQVAARIAGDSILCPVDRLVVSTAVAKTVSKADSLPYKHNNQHGIM